MYKHIILFNFMDSVPEVTALQLLNELGQLREVIPQIKAYCYGKNDRHNRHNKEYQYAFVMTFSTREDRYIYQNHPAHIALVENRVSPVVSDAIVFDLEDCFISQEVSAHV